MALSDFLTEGSSIPAGSAVESVTKQTVLPDWYTSYATNLLSGQQAVSDTPYPTYQGPRVAGFTPTQQQGFNMTGQAAGSYQGPLSSAIGAATTASGTQALPSAQPYFNAATALNPSAMAAPDYSTARNLATNATGMSGSTVAAPWLTAAAGINPMTAAQPNLDNATSMAGNAVSSGGGLAAAQPYLANASGNTTDVSAYMNPYTDQVVNHIAELGARNLNENIMPGIEGRYIQAGQLGYGPQGGASTPSGMMTDTARAIRDTQDSVLNQQTAALEQGYNNAVQTSLADSSRNANLASTAGGLGTAQQNAGLTAASLNANVGSTAGGLAQAYQDALTKAGATAGGLATSDAGTQLSAANQVAGLGTAAGGLTQAQQQLLASMGVNVGNLTTADANTGLAAADKLGGLASLSQNLGLAGANAVTATGDKQQALNQQNLDVAYQDFLKQQGYPQAQIDAMMNTFKGVSTGIPSATTEEGIVPSGQQAAYQPSTASQVASGLAGVAGILSAIGKL